MIRPPPRSPLFPSTTLFRSVAYPERAANPIPALLALLQRLQERRLDEGYPAFPPSKLELTTVDVGKDRKSTRLNSSHANISYAVFCLKKKQKSRIRRTTART